MAGGTYTYSCGHCPLIFELGGWTAWSEERGIISDTIQTACGACGTMHRIATQQDECLVYAVPTPIHEYRTKTVLDVIGETFEMDYLVEEDEWLKVGPLHGGESAISQLSCNYCHRVGSMFCTANYWKSGRQAEGFKCTICKSPMEIVGVTSISC